MAFEKRLGVGERRVEVGQRSASLSRWGEQQVQRPRGRSTPGGLRNSPEADPAGVQPARRREVEDEVWQNGAGTGGGGLERLFVKLLIWWNGKSLEGVTRGVIQSNCLLSIGWRVRVEAYWAIWRLLQQKGDGGLDQRGDSDSGWWEMSDYRYILSGYFLWNVDTHNQIFFQKVCINSHSPLMIRQQSFLHTFTNNELICCLKIFKQK